MTRLENWGHLSPSKQEKAYQEACNVNKNKFFDCFFKRGQGEKLQYTITEECTVQKWSSGWDISPQPLHQHHEPCTKCTVWILNWTFFDTVDCIKWILSHYVFQTFELSVFRLVWSSLHLLLSSWQKLVVSTMSPLTFIRIVYFNH